MITKTAIAPTIELATAKVEKFTEKLRKSFGYDATIIRFYTCEPAESYVENLEGDKWTEGNWGVHILTDSFSISDIGSLNNLSGSVQIGDISVKPHDKDKVELSIWLTARVMR